MRGYTLTIIGFLTISFACPPYKTPDREPDKLISKDNWVLKIWINSKGSRSEGRYSYLYHKNKEVCPNDIKKEIDTPLGSLKYIENRYRWGWHGWKLEAKE